MQLRKQRLSTEVTIPAEFKGKPVTAIGYRSFGNCHKLTSIIIPNSVTVISDYAFSGCNGLKNISYKGTKAQWGSIAKGNNRNYNTGNYTIVCTDGKIEK